MSATNRGSTRKPHDFYPTPIPTIETFLDVFPLRGGIEVLEPGAGSGNIREKCCGDTCYYGDKVRVFPDGKTYGYCSPQHCPL